MSQENAAGTDALARIFLALGRHYNTNSNQILVVRGDLDLERLRGAVHSAARKFAHVLHAPGKAGGPWDPREVPVREIHSPHACSLQSEAFRDSLMRLSDRHRIDWRRQPATQVFLIRSPDRQTCCVYLNSAHAAADAASDCMFVGEVIAQYRSPCVVTAAAAAYVPLPVAAPTWFTWRARARRWLSAWWDVVASSVSGDRGMTLPASGRWGYGPADAAAAFSTSVLPDGEVEAARRAGKAWGVTLNTVFAAALVRLMAQRAGGPGQHALRFSLALSLRPLLPAEGRAHAFGNHIVTCTLRQPAGLRAGPQVQMLHRSVQDLKARRVQIEIGRFELALPFMAIDALRPITRRAMARAQITNVCYSNPGVIAQDFTSFGGPAHQVLEYTGLGCLVSPYDLMLYTTTVNGRTQLDALYRRGCFGSIENEVFLPFREQLGQLVAELLDSESAAAAPGRECFA